MAKTKQDFRTKKKFVQMEDYKKLEAENTYLRELLRAVDADPYGDMRRIVCDDIDGKNWFDCRDKALEAGW